MGASCIGCSPGSPCATTSCDFFSPAMSPGDAAKADILIPLFDVFNNGSSDASHHCPDLGQPSGPGGVSPLCDDVCSQPTCPCCDECPPRCEECPDHCPPCPCECPPPTEECGCTLTQGFWKTHHPEAWPTITLTMPLCGMLWIDILNTPPPQGSKWYILAHQYIAAQLNLFTGSCFTGITPQNIANATLLLNQNCPSVVPSPSQTITDKMQQLATLLASYNEGQIGPGHCDGDNPPVCDCPPECPPPPPPSTCEGGCVRTQGYWKTHSELWGSIDPAAFCPGPLNSITYLYYLSTFPIGDAYFILAKQYVAALQNINSIFTAACTSPEIDILMNTASTLLSDYCGIIIGNSHPLRATFISIGTILDDYNNGLLFLTGDGPQHC